MHKLTDARVTVAREILHDYENTSYAGMERGDLVYTIGRLKSALRMMLQLVDENDEHN